MKNLLKALCAALTAFSLSACGSAPPTAGENAAAVSFTDDDGRLVELDKPAERIISLYSAHTENLYYLGAGNKLIGGYKTCTYPPEAAFLDKYDYSSDPEKVIAANPDAVIIRPFISRKSPDFVKALEKAGIRVVSLYPDSFDDFDDYINKLAMLTGTEDRAREELSRFHEEINEIETAASAAEPKNKVFFESTDVNIRTVTPDSMAGRAIAYAGGINIAAGAEAIEDGSSIAPFGEERVLENADNIDVYISQRGSMNSGGNLETIGERAGFDTIRAVKNGRVYLINEKIISSPTFRYSKGVRETARFIYPELMDDCGEYMNDLPATRRSLANIMVKALHMPVYLPTSSSYYDTERKGHTFGLFEDVKWTDADFDYIETAVESGAIAWDKADGKEYYYPDREVTRGELANAVFVLGDFSPKTEKTPIADISECPNERIVQTLVDNGVFAPEDGRFNPSRAVTNNEIIAAMSFLNRQ